MSSTLKRVAAVIAMGAVGSLAPVASASAAAPPAFPATAFPATALPASALPAGGFALPAFPNAGLPAFAGVPLAFTGPSVGQVAAVIGPTILTTAPSSFTNVNNQVTAGSAVSGPQAAP